MLYTLYSIFSFTLNSLKYYDLLIVSFFTYFSNYNGIVTFNFLQKVFYSNSLVDLFHKSYQILIKILLKSTVLKINNYFSTQNLLQQIKDICGLNLNSILITSSNQYQECIMTIHQTFYIKL